MHPTGMLVANSPAGGGPLSSRQSLQCAVAAVPASHLCSAGELCSAGDHICVRYARYVDAPALQSSSAKQCRICLNLRLKYVDWTPPGCQNPASRAGQLTTSSYRVLNDPLSWLIGAGPGGEGRGVAAGAMGPGPGRMTRRTPRGVLP